MNKTLTTKDLALVAAIFILAIVQSFYWTLAALVTYLFRNLYADTPPTVAAESIWLALSFVVVVLVNVAAVLAFLQSHRGFGWWLIVVVQTADFLVMAVLSSMDKGPWLVAAAAGLTVLLLLFLRYMESPPRPG
jgi:hypothetical protein